jgi:hypothetical protein
MFGESFQSLVVGVCQRRGSIPSSEDEYTLSEMGEANFSRREHSVRAFVTDSFQLPEDMEQNRGAGRIVPSASRQLGAEDSLDVLKQDVIGSAGVDAMLDEREQVSGVGVGQSTSVRTERLTWEPSREDVHHAAKLSEREGFNIRVDRCRIQDTRLYFFNQVSHGKGFDLHISDGVAASWQNFSQSEFCAGISGAKAENPGRLSGMIHIYLSLYLFTVLSRFRPTFFGGLQNSHTHSSTPYCCLSNVDRWDAGFLTLSIFSFTNNSF